MRAKKQTKKQAVMELTSFKLEFLEKNYDLIREIALRMAFKVFPKMRAGNLYGVEDLIQSCREKCILVLPKWDPDKALNSASGKPKSSKLTSEEWIAKKNSNPEHYLQKNFEYFMAKAMENRLKHVRDAENFAKRYKAEGPVEVRSVDWGATMDKAHNSESSDTMLFDASASECLTIEELLVARQDYEYSVELAGQLDTKASLLYMATLPDVRKENMIIYAREYRLNRESDSTDAIMAKSTFETEMAAEATEAVEENESEVSDSKPKRRSVAS